MFNVHAGAALGWLLFHAICRTGGILLFFYTPILFPFITPSDNIIAYDHPEKISPSDDLITEVEIG